MKDVGPVTFEGYEFVIPANTVSSAWQPFGEFITTQIYKVEETRPEYLEKMKNKGIPPVIPVDKKDWDGSTFVEVRRFKIDPAKMPSREYIIRLAEQRGVEKELVNKFRTEPTITHEEMIAAINALPIPDEIRYPEKKPIIDKKNK